MWVDFDAVCVCVCLYGHAVFQENFTEHYQKDFAVVLQYLSDAPVSLNLSFNPTKQHIDDESLHCDVYDINL